MRRGFSDTLYPLDVLKAQVHRTLFLRAWDLRVPQKVKRKTINADLQKGRNPRLNRARSAVGANHASERIVIMILI
jgi:hypothetical protein